MPSAYARRVPASRPNAGTRLHSAAQRARLAMRRSFYIQRRPRTMYPRPPRLDSAPCAHIPTFRIASAPGPGGQDTSASPSSRTPYFTARCEEPPEFSEEFLHVPRSI
ncbi:hypothetical protein HYPSUDRAFT_44708 [Hypholoma sublateritium FD-334 SS-4]|uniref:Uncharacterized protein n=1 Tax=Hypholoma sublateritium (strain FD-334 SS-4) TaxID=945553 RepID=A0A0D2NQJ4_HYPSF|nr:hypothetical protein HYPSUDRAFT_44708 [Hypholoma sublateritium FD-334 SS-4]